MNAEKTTRIKLRELHHRERHWKHEGVIIANARRKLKPQSKKKKTKTGKKNPKSGKSSGKEQEKIIRYTFNPPPK